MGNNWAPKYTDRQREAVKQAALEYGYKAPQVVKAAGLGELPGLGRGLAPFAMPVTTARAMISDERRRIRADKAANFEPDSAMRIQAGRLLAVLDREVTRADRQSRTGRLNVQKLKELARAAREIEQLAKPYQAKPDARSNTKGKSGQQAASKRPGDFLDELAQEHEPSSAAQTDAHSNNGHGDGDTTAPRTEPTAHSTTD